MVSSEQLMQLNKTKTKRTKSGKTRSEIAKASKRKGKSGEHWFATKLSEISGMSFQRIPNSGAMVGLENRSKLAGMQSLQHLILLGDVISPIELKTNYIWECKNYQDLDIHNILKDSNSKTMAGWLDELLYDVESALMYRKDKFSVGFLCFKISRKGNWIVVNTNVIKNIQFPYPHTKFIHSIKHNLLKENGYGDEFVVCEFESFIQLNKDKIFITMEK